MLQECLSEDSYGSFPPPTSSPQDEQAQLVPYLYLVKRALTHLRSQITASMAREDLEQIGLLGLLEALRRYGTPDAMFEGFAFKRIRGAMLDELRRQDWRPRQLRQQANAFNQVVRKQTNQLGRMPNEQELAEILNITPDEVRELFYASQAEAMQSLDELLECTYPTSNGDDDFHQLEIQMSLKKALAVLSKRDQLLLALYYQYELNMKEIALVLDLTESRVCQLHKQTIVLLKNQLSELS
nr:FliA/WhiG family RNA polymerase sigma factor [uncultured Tolumonas sp.]